MPFETDASGNPLADVYTNAQRHRAAAHPVHHRRTAPSSQFDGCPDHLATATGADNPIVGPEGGLVRRRGLGRPVVLQQPDLHRGRRARRWSPACSRSERRHRTVTILRRRAATRGAVFVICGPRTMSAPQLAARPLLDRSPAERRRAAPARVVRSLAARAAAALRRSLGGAAVRGRPRPGRPRRRPAHHRRRRRGRPRGDRDVQGGARPRAQRRGARGPAPRLARQRGALPRGPRAAGRQGRPGHPRARDLQGAERGRQQRQAAAGRRRGAARVVRQPSRQVRRAGALRFRGGRARPATAPRPPCAPSSRR